jgi:hypothetical protein
VNNCIRHTSEFAFVANRNSIIDHCIVPDAENGYKAELQKTPPLAAACILAKPQHLVVFLSL